ncbi:hypothetical protein Moror_8654 [Moniliophthora roreri MCA 2997]|uniref:Uncharacterized protein n=2 Tax=Moniliophthora roreri TaxID=221103 RepID=V2WRU6_MONRO|nr:hypothetical protein Moror_8654 [Moniliophthora roreri MCA 2997]KAI3611335.1 hypothetical protein WG66_002203 [Moniliophthora roreri]
MSYQSPSQLRISSSGRSSPRRCHRYHPYPRLDYPDPGEEDTAYEPRIDSLLDIIRDVGHRARVPPLTPVAGVEEGEERQRAEQQVKEGNNRLVVGGILLLHFLLTYFLFVRRSLLVGFLFRGGRAENGE